MKLKNLNGWQRLWVVLSATWLVVVVFVIIIGEMLPATRALSNQLEADKAEIADALAQATIEVVWNDPNVKAKSPFGFVPNVESVRQEYSELDDVAFAERYQKAHPEVDFAELNALYDETLYQTQLLHNGEVGQAVLRSSVAALLAWIVPSVLAYLLGMGVAWVRRGFKEGESNE